MLNLWVCRCHIHTSRAACQGDPARPSRKMSNALFSLVFQIEDQPCFLIIHHHIFETHWNTHLRHTEIHIKHYVIDQKHTKSISFLANRIFPRSKVCKNFAFPKVKLICEPWRPPLRCCILATRKTAMVFQEQCYMLGCFSPVDEIEPWHVFQKTDVIMQGSEVGGRLLEFSKEVFLKNFWNFGDT